MRENNSGKIAPATIQEHGSEAESSERSDATSESNGSDTSSIDAALNGEEETEDQLYDRILAAQEGREVQEEQKKDKQVEELVDKNMINLLRVCGMLTRPTAEEVEQRKVYLGPKTKSKLLILDMDETLLHSKFHKLTGKENVEYPPGISQDANGVLEFHVLISNRPN